MTALDRVEIKKVAKRFGSERALAAGADAFITKRDCASGRLLAEVASVLSRTRGG